MSDFEQWSGAGDSAPHLKVNQNFEALEGASLFAERKVAHSGLVYGYMGGVFKDTPIAAGTVTLADDDDNYIVAALADGTISDATNTTNWDDDTTYARVAKVTTLDGAITAVVDYRFDEDGLFPKLANLSASGADNSQPGEMISGYISTVADKTYKLVVKAAHGGTITETTTISESGTCTATFKINTTALGGTANSVSNSEQSQSHASSNAFSAGDDIQVTVSSNSSCLGMSFTIKYTRVLD